MTFGFDKNITLDDMADELKREFIRLNVTVTMQKSEIEHLRDNLRELHDALSEIVKYGTFYNSAIEFDTYQDGFPGGEPLGNKASAALAKARGETQ